MILELKNSLFISPNTLTLKIKLKRCQRLFYTVSFMFDPFFTWKESTQNWETYGSFRIFFSPILHIYTPIPTFMNGVLSHRQKYSNTGCISTNILILSQFPKKGELIFGRAFFSNKPNIITISVSL